MLARTMADLNREQMLLREEGAVMMTERGTPVVNPRKTVVQMHVSSILSFRRSLSLHARTQGGEARDVQSGVEVRRKSRQVIRSKTTCSPAQTDETAAEKVCRVIETYCRVPEGALVGRPIKLLDFQREFIKAVYDNPAGMSRAYLSIARKNGKSLTDCRDSLGAYRRAAGEAEQPDYQRRPFSGPGGSGL
jgi:hypothetical protein